ncbi:hypothetical protein [Paenarthrobacter aurescens]|uniref:hypothetical protein n=1 Tax=Paenarthrobacter aurescens TaxID=43663 RepID=UPI0021BE56CD|nr:hypothetical protein [Paenarthrobacter aurescens]MCT9869915.1 hypothetical protein [Paenarthrobacter aurescens]
MSEHSPLRGRNDEQAIDRLMADSGLEGDADLRAELLELRSLASTAPLPSDAVRALMASGPAAATQQPTTADGGPASSGAPTSVLTTVAPTVPAPMEELAPVDELAARRRRKRGATIAGLAVVVSLAGGATAAVASDGGIPGAFQHLGAAIGSVVSQFTPGSGNVPQQGGPADSTPAPGVGETPAAPARNLPAPAPVAPTPTGAPESGSQPQPGGGASAHMPKAPGKGGPGNVIPTPPAVPVTPPALDAPRVDPSQLRPSDLPVPVPTHVVPSPPADPSIFGAG